ncbi:lipopolysaccharide assembly protein LapA domain-containing protein [Roseovarius sp. EL26]|uniref:lipopolysaccharide assembly protein LapA domain-containing protein n=1 Tax=Roseovarius sp. EL26 TaxID=2126672 RepID=UPI000EA3F4DE|nr:lipopolysaccharide assembly protein LapA domain-containing protein [Roseovarius sp. EL26]
MRYIRYASIAIFAVALILVAMANRSMVTLKIFPDELAHLAALNPSFQLPLFVVILGGILLGLIIGFVWEWIREAKERSEAARQAREMQRLQAEVKRLKGVQSQNKDEVLAILDEAS